MEPPIQRFSASDSAGCRSIPPSRECRGITEALAPRRKNASSPVSWRTRRIFSCKGMARFGRPAACILIGRVRGRGARLPVGVLHLLGRCSEPRIHATRIARVKMRIGERILLHRFEPRNTVPSVPEIIARQEDDRVFPDLHCVGHVRNSPVMTAGLK